jgi:hypothetical protein
LTLIVPLPEAVRDAPAPTRALTVALWFAVAWTTAMEIPKAIPSEDESTYVTPSWSASIVIPPDPAERMADWPTIAWTTASWFDSIAAKPPAMPNEMLVRSEFASTVESSSASALIWPLPPLIVIVVRSFASAGAPSGPMRAVIVEASFALASIAVIAPSPPRPVAEISVAGL